MEIIYPTSFFNLIEDENSNEEPFNYGDLNYRTPNYPEPNYDETYDSNDELDRYPTPGNPPNFPAPPSSQSHGPGNYNAGPNSKPPMGPPPSYTPSKSGKNVKYLGATNYKSPGGATLKYVSDDSIRFCLYKYTYIWQRNGRAYWAFLIHTDRRSVSGFRWINYRWGYFGLDLRSIDSFECY